MKDEYKLLFTGSIDIYQINRDGVYEKVKTLDAVIDTSVDVPPNNGINLGTGNERFTFEINKEGNLQWESCANEQKSGE